MAVARLARFLRLGFAIRARRHHCAVSRGARRAASKGLSARHPSCMKRLRCQGDAAGHFLSSFEMSSVPDLWYPSSFRCATRPTISRRSSRRSSAALGGRRAYEIVYVNDGSTDGTAGTGAPVGHASLAPEMRHAQSCGQSAAVRSGVRAARGVIVTLDGDGQNDPSSCQPCRGCREAGRAAGCAGAARRAQGHRLQELPVAHRQPRARAVLKRGTRDTGAAEGFPREAYLALPYFDALHRFMPALVRREGLEIAYVDVVDRPRHTGVSNYGFFDRLWIGRWISSACGG